MEFSKNTKLRDIDNAPELLAARGCLISGGDFFVGANGEMTLAKLQEKNPTWFHGDIAYGLERLQREAERGSQYVCPVYDDTDPQLSRVKMIFLPAEKKTHSTYAILMSGGAYGAVCTMVESLPVAAKLNELGISCFCLNYRTAVQECFAKGLLPKPIDDLAAACRFIQHHQSRFGINAEDYIIGGFSAGGHVASLWGTAHLGARKYGIPQPKMLLLTYPLITMEHTPDSPVKAMMCTGMFGAGYTLDDIRHYDTGRHVDAEYPKVYLTHTKDDPVISAESIDSFASALDTARIPFRLEQAQWGGHGFGLGNATDVRGWVERAVAFIGV